MEFIEPTITDRELRHFMLMVDIDGSGEVSLEEFTRAVRGAVMAEAGDRKADPSAAGDADVVRVDDIIRRLRQNMESTGQSVAEIFKKFDADGNGQLEGLEIVKFFKHACPGLNQMELRYLMQRVHELDVDGDGKVSLAELRSYIKEQKVARSAPSSPTVTSASEQKLQQQQQGGAWASSLSAPQSSPAAPVAAQQQQAQMQAAAQQQQQQQQQQQMQMQVQVQVQQQQMQAQAAAMAMAQAQAQQQAQQQQMLLAQQQEALQKQQQQLAALQSPPPPYAGGLPATQLAPPAAASAPAGAQPPAALAQGDSTLTQRHRPLITARPGDRNIFSIVLKYIEKNDTTVQALFQRFDKGGVSADGQLSMAEIERMMEAIEPTITDRELRYFCVICDVNGDGEISASEFSSALKSGKAMSEKLRSADALADGDEDVVRVSDLMSRLAHFVTAESTTAQAVFNQFDKDGNGTLDAKELRDLFSTLLPALDATEMRYLLANLAEVDTDGDGALSLAELREYFERVGPMGAGIAKQFAESDKAAVERARRSESPEELLRIAKAKIEKAASENVFKRARTWLKAQIQLTKDDFFLLRTFDTNQDGTLGYAEIGTLGRTAVQDISAAQLAYFKAMLDVEGAYAEGVERLAKAGTTGYDYGRPPPTGTVRAGMTQRGVLEALRACSELHRKVHDPALTVQEDEDLSAGEVTLRGLSETLEQFRGVLKRAFDHYDADKDGMCDYPQMVAVFRSLRPNCTKKDVRLWLVRMAACDKLNQGAVAYADVKALITSRAVPLGARRQLVAQGSRLPALAPLGAMPPQLPPGVLGGAQPGNGAISGAGLGRGAAAVPFPTLPLPAGPASAAPAIKASAAAAPSWKRELPPLGEAPKGTPAVNGDDAPPGGWKRLMVISSRVGHDEVPAFALKSHECGCFTYEFNRTTPAGLLHAIRTKLNDSPVESLALVTNSKAATIVLTKGFRTDIDTLKAVPGVRAFWQDLSQLVAPGGRIDLLGSSVAAGDGMKMMARLEGLTGVDFAASDDIAHEVGDFFLESDNIDAAKVYFEQDAFDKWYASLGHKVPPPDAFAAQKEQMQGSLEAQLRQAVAAGDVHEEPELPVSTDSGDAPDESWSATQRKSQQRDGSDARSHHSSDGIAPAPAEAASGGDAAAQAAPTPAQEGPVSPEPKRGCCTFGRGKVKDSSGGANAQATAAGSTEQVLQPPPPLVPAETAGSAEAEQPSMRQAS